MRRLVGRMVDALSERLADRISRKVLSQFYFRELHPPRFCSAKRRPKRPHM